MIDQAEHEWFIAWTFEQELDLLEEMLGEFDRNAPNASLDTASFELELLALQLRFPGVRGFGNGLMCSAPE